MVGKRQPHPARWLLHLSVRFKAQPNMMKSYSSSRISCNCWPISHSCPKISSKHLFRSITLIYHILKVMTNLFINWLSLILTSSLPWYFIYLFLCSLKWFDTLVDQQDSSHTCSSHIMLTFREFLRVSTHWTPPFIPTFRRQLRPTLMVFEELILQFFLGFVSFFMNPFK